MFADTAFSGRIDVHPVLVKETMYRLPFSLIPQVAFIGRSNVGKSSLVNALLHGREVARPSPMAGRTRQLFTFDVSDTVSLVDLPGYGFSGKVDKSDKDAWLIMMQDYISKANALELFVSLIDCRHGIKSIDEQFWTTLSETPFHSKRSHGAHILVCLTKTDLISTHEMDKLSRSTVSTLEHFRNSNKHFKLWPYLHAVSAESGLGLKELRASITSMCPISDSDISN